MEQRLLAALVCFVFACSAGDDEVARDPGQPLPGLTATDLERFAQGHGKEDPMTYSQFLTRYTNNFSRATRQKWRELGDFLWAGLARAC